MFDDLGNGQATNYMLAVAIVAVALLALFVALWLIRKRSNSTFIRGGKNRQPRLAVLDAAAVDTRRRLVLVRRDGVEHLILIGGPTDIVVESGIIPGPSAVQQTPETAVEQPAPSPRAAREGATAAGLPALKPAPDPAPASAAKAAPAAVVAAAAKPVPAPRSTPSAPPSASVAAPPSASVAAPPAPPAAERPGSDPAENALDVLDAARARVLSGSEKASAAAPPAQTPVAPQETAPKPATIADAYFEDDAKPAPAPAEKRDLSPEAMKAQRETAARFAATVATGATASPRLNPTPPPTAEETKSPQLSDFEAILESELAEDFDLGGEFELEDGSSRDDADAGGDLSGVSPGTGQTGDSANIARSKTAAGDTPRKDSLEEEMDKLLGDLSRRN